MAPSSRSISQTCSKIGVTGRRIRNANQKKGETLACQFRPRVQGIEDPRVSQTKVKASKVNLYPRMDAAVPQNHPIEGIDKVSVTPSPKPMPSVSVASSLAPIESRAQQRKLAPTTMLTTRQHGSQQQPNRSSTHASTRNLIQPSRNDALPTPPQFQCTHHAPPACRQDHDVHSAFRSEPKRESSLKRSQQASNNDHNNRFSFGAASAWKRLKRQQQESQQRAFVHKKDNPFSLYKHDPNDTESYLELLSSHNNETLHESIIPPEGFETLANASKAQIYSAPGAATGHPHRPPHQRGRQRGRRESFGTAISTQELLAQKAAEHNAHTTVATPAPAFNSGQLWYSQPGSTFHPAFHAQAAFYPNIGVRPEKYAPNVLDSWAGNECDNNFTQHEGNFCYGEPEAYGLRQSSDESRPYTHAVREYGYSYAQQPMNAGQASFHSDYISANFQGVDAPLNFETQMEKRQPYMPGFSAAPYSSGHGSQFFPDRSSRMVYQPAQYQGMNEEDIETAFF
jgi:hypothetical protein